MSIIFIPTSNFGRSLPVAVRGFDALPRGHSLGWSGSKLSTISCCMLLSALNHVEPLNHWLVANVGCNMLQLWSITRSCTFVTLHLSVLWWVSKASLLNWAFPFRVLPWRVGIPASQLASRVIKRADCSQMFTASQSSQVLNSQPPASLTSLWMTQWKKLSSIHWVHWDFSSSPTLSPQKMSCTWFKQVAL
jgi:hypothetical protein